jgi:class 3 adenylate cyclase
MREAERRQLTLMFCDLVGSTELSGRHDPEDLRELLGRYHDAMTEVVVRHGGGYLANYQAVRAGLDAVVAVRELALQARVGIASGTVVVGDIEAAGRRQMMGEPARPRTSPPVSKRWRDPARC